MRGRLAYEMTSGVTVGVNISCDEAFDTIVSADLKVRFGGADTISDRIDVEQKPIIKSLILTPIDRNILVYDSTTKRAR